jgi:hypothetical protein
MRARSSAVYLVAGLVLSACSVDRAGLNALDSIRDADGGHIDLGALDLGGTDLAMRDSTVSDPDLGPAPRDLGPAPPDLGPPDLGSTPVDLGPPDLGPPDLGPPDLGPPDLGLESPTCDAQYSAADSYRLCAERATECEFYTRLGGISCNERCSGLGGRCITAHNNGFWGRCDRDETVACDDTSYDDVICVCSR